MDPFTPENTMTLATIIGLLCNFKQERGASQSAKREDFLRYLDHHRYTELKDLISQTHHLSSEVDRLLQEDHVVIIEKLNALDSMLALITSKIDGLSGISAALSVGSELSRQAQEILRIFFDSGAKSLIIIPAPVSVLHLSNGGEIGNLDQRFLEDDLRTLCDAGLLSEHAIHAGTQYKLTRLTEAYLKTPGLEF